MGNVFSNCVRNDNIDIVDFIYKGSTGKYSGPVAPIDVIRVKVDPSVKVIVKKPFIYFKSLTTLILSEGLEIIDKYALAYRYKLEAIHIPSTVKEIRGSAFLDCKSLKSVSIPTDIKIVDKGAFKNCHAIKSVSIPFHFDIIDLFIGNQLESVTFTDVPMNPSEIPTEPLETEPLEGNTVLHSSVQNNNLAFTTEILKLYPSSAAQKNTLGQTPFHLCIANSVSIEIADAIFDAFPKAATIQNEIGKSALDYWKEMGCDEKYKMFFRYASSSNTKIVYLLQNENATIIDEKAVLLRGHYLLLELAATVAKNVKIYKAVTASPVPFRELFSDQLQARNLLFNKLMTEFSELVECNETLIIQRAAAIQALCPKKNLENASINFDVFSSSALWYQQEILTVVIRVYTEDQLMDRLVAYNSYGDTTYAPSALEDAERAQADLEAGKEPPKPLENRTQSFMELKDYIVKGLHQDDYSFEGPVLKSLQSLFNKMYIRRGQTKVSVIADMTRATLYIKNWSDLTTIVARLEKLIPKCGTPDQIGINAFLHQVSKMPKVPNTEIIPYRFKANSSQKKGTPLLYNLNFFHEIPEYHRVGNTEMFVAFELQIGLEATISGLRDDHVTYDKERILEAQPLLNSYLEDLKETKPSASVSSTLSTEVESIDELNLYSAILEGNFSDCALQELDKKVISSKPKSPTVQIRAPDRLCLNNKRLNCWSKEGKAVVLDGPFALDPSRRYSVDSLYVKMKDAMRKMSVGLFANLGPYLFQVSARFVGWDDNKDDSPFYMIKSGMNYLTMESISLLPVGCDSIVLVAWGEPVNNYDRVEWWDFINYLYFGMELKLKVYEERNE